jgi:hypothetical protein
MPKHDRWTKIIAICGTVVAGLPLVFTILTAAVGSWMDKRFLFDWMMPAELFPFVLAGSALLVWAAWRAQWRRMWFAVGVVLLFVLLFGGQALAVVSGLADGSRPAQGVWWAIVVGSIALYDLVAVGLAVLGVQLSQRVFRPAL